MATRRRVRHHRKRYRGGEEFIEKKFVMPAGVNPRAFGTLKARHEAAERARYEAWKKSREVEAREDAKGREEDAKMAAFNAKQIEARKAEVEELRLKKSEEKQDEATDDMGPSSADVKNCKKTLKSRGIMSLSKGKEWLANKENRKAGAAVYAEVVGCVKTIEASRQAAGRRTRRRKSHRRR
jgi:hypothetical protein